MHLAQTIQWGGNSIMFLPVLSGKVKTGGFVLVSEQRSLPSNP